MEKLLVSLKKEIEDHRDRMASAAQEPFELNGHTVRIIALRLPCPTITAYVGEEVRLEDHRHNMAGAARLAAAIVVVCGVQWMDYGPELLSLINIAMRIDHECTS